MMLSSEFLVLTTMVTNKLFLPTAQ